MIMLMWTHVIVSTVASFLLWFCPELVEDIILSSQIYVSGLISLFISFISPLFHLLSFRPDHLFHLLCGLLRLLQRELVHGNATTSININYSGHQNNINNTTTSIHQCLWELLHGNTTNPGVHLPRCTPGRQNINNIATWIHIFPFQVPIQVYTYSALLLLILLAEFGAGIAALVPSLLLFLIYSYDNTQCCHVLLLSRT